MAKFMLIKISLMAEIADADALREAALKNFDAADMTSDDHPDTADWHASEEGQEERRQVATRDLDALTQFVDPAKACEMLDGVPGIKAVPLGSARPNWRRPRSTRPATPGRNARGLHGGPVRSRLTDAKHPEITTALCTAPRPARPATLARLPCEPSSVPSFARRAAATTASDRRG